MGPGGTRGNWERAGVELGSGALRWNWEELEGIGMGSTRGRRRSPAPASFPLLGHAASWAESQRGPKAWGEAAPPKTQGWGLAPCRQLRIQTPRLPRRLPNPQGAAASSPDWWNWPGPG